MTEPQAINPRPVGRFMVLTGPIPRDTWEEKETLKAFLDLMIIPDLDKRIQQAGHVRDGEFKQDFGGYYRLEAVGPTEESPEGSLIEIPVIDPITEEWDHVRIRMMCSTWRKDIYEARKKQDGEWHDV